MKFDSNDSASYLLITKMAEPCEIAVGALGNVAFKRGYYVYVGSARRGLHSRIARHLRKEKKLRWHIDYLLQRGFVERVFVSTEKSELELGRSLLDDHRFDVVNRFGSSDSPLPGHLFFCATADSADAVMTALPSDVQNATEEYSLA